MQGSGKRASPVSACKAPVQTQLRGRVELEVGQVMDPSSPPMAEALLVHRAGRASGLLRMLVDQGISGPGSEGAGLGWRGETPATNKAFREDLSLFLNFV